ncbi:MAG: SMC-Scp complex subunit ScpB [Armatimonadota bacterium]|nr:SMC-Scp complex subunit ScpB [bacterium]
MIATDAQNNEVAEVVSVEPLAEASVSEVMEAEVGVVLAEQPEPKQKKGRGLAALFIRKPRTTKQEGNEQDVVVQSDTAQNTTGTPRLLDAPAPETDIEEVSHEEVPLHKNGKLRSVIECMLFVATEPLSTKQLAQTLDLEESRVQDAIAALDEDLSLRGLQLARVAGGYQLCTRPEFSEYCAMLLHPGKKKLSKAALETLAVVAYRQPCTMPEVEAVRGVAVDGVMKTLMERGLVKEAGRKQTPGRPILYATTPEFLEYFGLNDISELPDIDMLAVEEVKALEAQRELFVGDGVDEEAEDLEQELESTVLG